MCPTTKTKISTKFMIKRNLFPVILLIFCFMGMHVNCLPMSIIERAGICLNHAKTTVCKTLIGNTAAYQDCVDHYFLSSCVHENCQPDDYQESCSFLLAPPSSVEYERCLTTLVNRCRTHLTTNYQKERDCKITAKGKCGYNLQSSPLDYENCFKKVFSECFEDKLDPELQHNRVNLYCNKEIEEENVCFMTTHGKEHCQVISFTHVVCYP